MDARFFNRPALLLCGLALLAVLTGLAVSWLEPQWAVASIFGVAAVSMVLYDYRIGVVFLTLMLPWFSSPLIPQARGFDLINFLVLASIGSLAVRRGFGRASLVPLPRVVRWCYLLPIAVAAVVAVPNLPIGAANFPAEAPSYYQAFATDEFLKTRVIKPMFFLVYAFLVANAVRDSARAERLLLVFGCSAVLPALAIIITAVAGEAAWISAEPIFKDWAYTPTPTGCNLHSQLDRYCFWRPERHRAYTGGQVRLRLVSYQSACYSRVRAGRQWHTSW